MSNIASPIDPVEPDLGKETGLLHEMFITGRKVGATKDFFIELAHDQAKFRAALDVVYNKKTFHVNASVCDIVAELSTYVLGPVGQGVTPQILSRFESLEFPSENFNVTVLGGQRRDLSIGLASTYLCMRGYRSPTLPEALLLVRTKDFIDGKHHNFYALGTPTCGVDGLGTFYPNIGIGADGVGYFGLYPATHLLGGSHLFGIKLQS